MDHREARIVVLDSLVAEDRADRPAPARGPGARWPRPPGRDRRLRRDHSRGRSSTYRQTELCLRAGGRIGDPAEPTGFLLHLLAKGGCVTHAVPVSHAAALVSRF